MPGSVHCLQRTLALLKGQSTHIRLRFNLVIADFIQIMNQIFLHYYYPSLALQQLVQYLAGPQLYFHTSSSIKTLIVSSYLNSVIKAIKFLAGGRWIHSIRQSSSRIKQCKKLFKIGCLSYLFMTTIQKFLSHKFSFLA